MRPPPHWQDRLTFFRQAGSRRLRFGAPVLHLAAVPCLHIDFSAGAPLPRAKPDDTAAERRSISASGNALAINVILKAAMTSPPQIAKASCTSSSIASAAVGDL